MAKYSGTNKYSVVVSRYIIHLILQEFSKYELCCAGVYSWPHWHWPVILLYGGHVALNQVGSVLKSSKENGQLDYGTTGKTNIR